MRHIWIGAAAVALAGCMEEPQVTGAMAFAEDCAACHGGDGRGGGPLAAQIGVTVPDLTTLAVRSGGTFPRDEVMTVIDGYVRGDHFSDVMPEFGRADMGPVVMVEMQEGLATPVPERLLALADYLERIQRAP